MYAVSLPPMDKKAFCRTTPRRFASARIRSLERAARRHPVLACALAQIVFGVGMAAAVALTVLAVVLPVWALCLL